MKNLSTKIVSSLAVLGLVLSCGDSSTKKNQIPANSGPTVEEAQEEIVPVDGSNINGLYRATFITLNPQVNGTIPGGVTFMRKEDKFFAYLRLFAGMPKAWHMQDVYVGNRCPTPNDDTNLDGFIDVVEARAVLGKILIPLDADISSQNSGKNFYPVADPSGSYHYERVTSFNRLFQDLKSEDKNPDDPIAKLAPDEGLEIVGKTVMILGITEDIELPDTVQTLERRRNFQTFPIACGVFEKVEEALPGIQHSDADEIPGPVADVIEGQDQPAPDDEGGDGSTTGETGRNDDSNDSDDGNGPVSDGEGRTSGGTTTGSTSGSEGAESTSASSSSSSVSVTTSSTGGWGGWIGSFTSSSSSSSTGGETDGASGSATSSDSSSSGGLDNESGNDGEGGNTEE